MFIQTLIVIAAISVFALKALAFAAVRHYQGKLPPLLPFSVFKLICRLDNSISADVDAFRRRASAILAYPYDDVRYTDWRESLMRRNRKWTAMEWLAFDAQMYAEQERGRSEQTRACLDALREKQLTLKAKEANPKL